MWNSLDSSSRTTPSTVEEFTSPSPEATVEAELDKSEPNIRVLNGSGIAGVASSVKDFLEGKGYKVSAISNATSYDFEQTVIRFKESFKKYAPVLWYFVSVPVTGFNQEF